MLRFSFRSALVSVALLICFAVAERAYLARAQDTTTTTPQAVELMQKQADERKAFYKGQAQQKEDLKKRLNEEREELLAKHRTARSKFAEETHTSDERKIFFRSERQEMGDLQNRQTEERKKLKREQQEKLVEFRKKQKDALDQIQAELLK